MNGKLNFPLASCTNEKKYATILLSSQNEEYRHKGQLTLCLAKQILSFYWRGKDDLLEVKTMLKRIITALLAVVMVASMTVAVFASFPDQTVPDVHDIRNGMALPMYNGVIGTCIVCNNPCLLTCGGTTGLYDENTVCNIHSSCTVTNRIKYYTMQNCQRCNLYCSVGMHVESGFHTALGYPLNVCIYNA